MNQDTALTIQAISAAVQAAAALILFGITWVYVRHTAALAKTAAEQLRFIQDEHTRQRRSALESTHARAHHLLELLQALPRRASGGTAESAFRTLPVWTREDLNAILELSLEIGGEAAMDIGYVTADLQWIASRVHEVRSTSERLGFSWGNFDWDEWEKRYNRALDGLLKIGGASAAEAGL